MSWQNKITQYKSAKLVININILPLCRHLRLHILLFSIKKVGQTEQQLHIR